MLQPTCSVLLLVAIASSQAHAEKANDKNPPVANTKTEKGNMLSNAQAWKIYETYLSGWRDVSDAQRAKIAAEIIAENVQYVTPRHDLSGRATMIEDMASFQRRLPKGHIDIGDVTAHHDVALLTWILVQADGKVYAKGHDQIRVSPDGKIVNLITFAPPVEKP